jgi:hypothetical protein
MKTENQILRSKLPRRIDVTPAKREKLVKIGRPLGGKLKELMSIVSPRAFTRWANGETKSVGKKTEENKGGRPRKPEEVRELFVTMAKENAWGLGRILGELKKLGLQKISKGTVRNILLENGFELGPKRGPGTWDELIKIHAKTLWLLGHYVVRDLMYEAALQKGVDPQRISFTATLNILRCRLPECPKSPRGLRKWYQTLLEEIAEEILPERRNRINPRVIKRKMSCWAKKKAEHRHYPQPVKEFRPAIVLIR